VRIAIFTPFIYPFHISMYNLLNSITETHLYTCGIFGNYPFEELLKKADILRCMDFLGNKIVHPLSILKLLKHRPHLVIIYGIESIAGLSIYFFSKMAKVRTIVVVEENNRTSFNKKLLNALRSLKEVFVRVAYATADVLITESKASRKYVSEILRVPRKKPIYVRPHGIDIKPFIKSRAIDKREAKITVVRALGLPNNIVDKLWLAFVGEPSYCKGADILIDAIEILGNLAKEIFNEYVFLLPRGSNLLRDAPNLKPVYLRKLSELMKKNKVILFPPVKVDLMPIFYRAVDMVILPSRFLRHASSDRSPNVALEALASGTLLVASYVGGIPDIVGDGGILIKPNDPHVLAKKLEDIIRNYQAYRHLEEKAYRRAMSYLDIRLYTLFLLRILKNLQKSKD